MHSFYRYCTIFFSHTVWTTKGGSGCDVVPNTVRVEPIKVSTMNIRVVFLQTAFYLCCLPSLTLQQEVHDEPRQRPIIVPLQKKQLPTEDSASTSSSSSSSSSSSEFDSHTAPDQRRPQGYRIEDSTCDYSDKYGSYNCEFDITKVEQDDSREDERKSESLGTMICFNERTHDPVDMSEEQDEPIPVICATISLSRRTIPATLKDKEYLSADDQQSSQDQPLQKERSDSETTIRDESSQTDYKSIIKQSSMPLPLDAHRSKEFPIINFEPRINMILLSHYPEPLNQYGEGVASFLRLWKSNAFASFAIADGWHQLGALHRQEALITTDPSHRTQQLVWAVKAFQMSNQNYAGLPSWNDVTEPYAEGTVQSDAWFGRLLKLRRAVVYYFWGESLLLLEVDQDQGMEMPIVDQSSTQMFQEASKLFNGCCGHVLFQDPPNGLDEPSRARFTREHSQLDFLHELWNQARSAWAQTLLQLGTYEVQKSAESSSINMETLQEQASLLMDELAGQSQEAQAKAVQDLYLKQLPQLFTLLEKAESYLLQSIALFRLLLEEDERYHDTAFHETSRSLATALQNYATAVMSKGDVVESTRYLEQALNQHARNFESLLLVQNDLHNANEKDKVEANTIVQELKSAIGEVLHSLANLYLQQGKYDKAQEHYTSCMDWYKSHQLPPSLDLDYAMDLSESIQQYEDALEEYQELFANEADYNHMGHGAREMGNDGLHYQRDDGYEADLHNALATLYMTNGDFTMAQIHLEQAVQLYSISGERQENYFADVLLNQATLAFRQGHFEKSAESYKEAVAMYEKHHANEGTNLMMEMGSFDMNSYKSLLEQAKKDSQQQQHVEGQTLGSYEERVEVAESGELKKEEPLVVSNDQNNQKIRVLMTNDEDDFQNKTEKIS